MSFSQQPPSYARSSHAPAQRDAMRAMLVAAAFDDEAYQGVKSPDAAEWSSGSGDGPCIEDVNDKPVATAQPSRKRSAASLAEPSERPAKHAKCSPCVPNAEASPPSSSETSPSVHACPAWEGLGKGFLDLALGLVEPLDASCVRTPSPSPLSDQEKMDNALRMFNRELDERLGNISL